MQRFYAASFVALFSNLDTAGAKILTVGHFAPGVPTEDARKQAAEALATLRNDTVGLPLSFSLREQIKRAAGYFEGAQSFSGDVLWTLICELKKNLAHEMSTHLFLSVPEEKRRYFEQVEPLFGQAVKDAFPTEASADIADAGRCFALDQWTACVFHLMRAVEHALHDWGRSLGVALKQPIELANWDEILKAADRKREELRTLPRSPERADELGRVGETLSHFIAIKDAWRNDVMHGHRSYSEPESLAIMQHVSAFMKAAA